MSAVRLATHVLATAGLGLLLLGAAPPKAGAPEPADQAVQKIVASPAFKTAVATLDAQLVPRAAILPAGALG